MGDNNKPPLFYICVDNADDLGAAWRIYTFLRLGGAKHVFCPVFKLQTCVLFDEKLLDRLKKKYEKIVIVCLSRRVVLLRREGRILLSPWKRLSFLDKLRYVLYTRFPKLFYWRYFEYFFLGAFNRRDKQIIEILLPMDLIEKTGSEPLAVFIHELLHIGREEDCPVEGCIGRSYTRAGWGMCKECRKLLKEIIKGNF